MLRCRRDRGGETPGASIVPVRWPWLAERPAQIRSAACRAAAPVSRPRSRRPRRRRAPAAAAPPRRILKQQLAARERELAEAREQQAASAEVLALIARSAGDLQPVFDAILAHATRICDAKFGVLFRAEGEAFRTVAMHGAPPAFVEERRRNPLFRPGPPRSAARPRPGGRCRLPTPAPCRASSMRRPASAVRRSPGSPARAPFWRCRC